jgi:hypothetical protein
MVQQVSQPTTAKRSWASRITTGPIKSPPKMLIFGQPGVGKSVLACSAPKPIVIQGERGTNQINVPRFDMPDGWSDVREQVQVLIDEDLGYQTLVLDTLDGLEGFMLRDICREANVDAIEKAWGGYGKGFTRAVERWRELLSQLERLAEKRGMAIVMVAHSMVKGFANPEGADYDRWIPRLNEKAWGAIYGWCDAVLFAHYETANTATQIDGKGKAVSTGIRKLRTTKAAAVEAKNRYGFPELIEMRLERGWDAIAEHLDAPQRLRAEISMTLAQVKDPALADTVNAWLANVGENATELAEGLARLKARLASAAPAAQN